MPVAKNVAKLRIEIDLDGGNSGPIFAIYAFGGSDDDDPSFRCNSREAPNMMEVLQDVFSKVTVAFDKSPRITLCTDGNRIVRPTLCGPAVSAPVAASPGGAALHAASAALQAAAMAVHAAALHTSHSPAPAETPAETKAPPKKSRRRRKRGDADDSDAGASDPK